MALQSMRARTHSGAVEAPEPKQALAQPIDAPRAFVLGALAAVPIALLDVALSWTWLPALASQLEFAARVMLLEVPLGGLLAAGLTAFGRRMPSRSPARAPLPLVALLSPLAGLVAWLLFTGGSARQLPLRPLWVIGATAVLLVALYASLRLAAAVVRRRSRLGALGLVAVAAASLAVDHALLPGLYDYLHLTLAAAAWAALGFALAAVVSPPRLSGRAALVVGIAAAGLFAANLASVGQTQAVQLALLSPRTTVPRGVLRASAPLRGASAAADGDAVAAAQRARARRRGLVVEGPSIEGAHLLLITVDALRADRLGLYGYDARPVSPELDALAESAVVFERAYAQAPHSSYSIGSLMTSDYLLQRSQLGLPIPEPTIATVLRESGYHTAALFTDGIFHTDGERLAHLRDTGFGFERQMHDELGAELKTEAALGEIDTVVAAGEPPSALWVHYFDVHEPYRDTRFGESDADRYDSEIRHVDAEIARLIGEARARLSRPIVIALTADHGEEFREHGGVYHGSTVYEEQVRVPLLVWMPQLDARRVPQPVELVDLAPTLLGLLGVAPPPSMRGDDLRPLMEGDPLELGPAFATAGYRHMALDWPHKLIADLRFGAYELFDLEADPPERLNRADDDPARVEALRGEVRAWLAGLAEDDADPELGAIYRGRARDSGAIPDLAALLQSRTSEPSRRAEAAQLLGQLPADESKEALAAALADGRLETEAPEVAREAAIALGRLYDARAVDILRRLVASEDRELRTRAAIALGRTGDVEAVPALLECLSEELPRRRREDAIHLMGTLRDPRAVEPLIGLLGEMRVRRRAILALGRIGDARAFEPLTVQEDEAVHSSVQDAIARAYGQLGDARGLPRVLALARLEETPSAGESLVRLGAIGSLVGGLDLGPPRAGTEGLSACRAGDPHHAWNYTGTTTCRLEGSARLTISMPAGLREGTLLVRGRRVDSGAAVEATVTIDGQPLEALEFDSEWAAPRRSASCSGDAPVIEVGVPEGVVLELDHVLWLPPE